MMEFVKSCSKTMKGAVEEQEERVVLEKSQDRVSNSSPFSPMDIDSIPAMSSECERVFPQVKRVTTDDRNRLSATTI